jgi:nucleotide-binding universal stress UspA family protein
MYMETLHAPSIAPDEDVRAGATLPVIVPANDGLVDADTALSLIGISNVPVLAVANGFTRSPRRIVVAVDFSEVSLRVARLAVDLAGPNALIYLAHAISRDSALRDASTVGLSCRHNAADALLKMCTQLRLAPGLSLHRILLQGDPATEVLAFATNGSADLIAIGSHGRGFLTREFVGGVATRILQHSRCSVLTVPYDVNSTAGGPTTNA